MEEKNGQAVAIEIGGIDEARRKAEELADLLDKAGKLARDIGKTARYWDAVRELAMNVAVILCIAAAAVMTAAVCVLIIRS